MGMGRGNTALVVHYLYPAGYAVVGRTALLEHVDKHDHVYRRGIPGYSGLLAEPAPGLPSLAIQETVVPLASHHGLLLRDFLVHVAFQRVGTDVVHVLELV